MSQQIDRNNMKISSIKSCILKIITTTTKKKKKKEKQNTNQIENNTNIETTLSHVNYYELIYIFATC